jgi:hypothetical protein
MADLCHSSSDNVFGPAVQGCRSYFDFTLLFEQSILTIGPAAILLLCTGPRIAQLWKASKKTLPNSILHIKMVRYYGTKIMAAIQAHNYLDHCSCFASSSSGSPCVTDENSFYQSLYPGRHSFYACCLGRSPAFSLRA